MAPPPHTGLALLGPMTSALAVGAAVAWAHAAHTGDAVLAALAGGGP